LRSKIAREAIEGEDFATKRWRGSAAPTSRRISRWRCSSRLEVEVACALELEGAFEGADGVGAAP
jgi:hypothetical protein